MGQQGEQIRIKPGQKAILNAYFDRYQTRGFIKLTSLKKTLITPTTQLTKKHTTKRIKQIPTTHLIPATIPIVQPNLGPINPPDMKTHKEQRIVGRRVHADATELLRTNLNKSSIPISNNIGVGILSYNRHHSLKRLVNSIITNTNINQTTIFISDDNSTDTPTLEYLNTIEQQGNIIVLKNNIRLGVAGNSNRLLRCLSRFKYGIILNDDIEILQQGWEYLYADAMVTTNMHHFAYKQEGVYGTTRGNHRKVNNINLLMVMEKPHGAVLAFDNTMLSKCGYFDESYGYYGMEHVDWSKKAWEFSLQQPGFWDLADADKYFKLHPEPSAVPGRAEQLDKARQKFRTRNSTYIGPTTASVVPEITYIIPFRNVGNADREGCIQTVVENVRAQRYPVIQLLLIEQDKNSNVNVQAMQPASHYLVPNPYTDLFNKSQAFNVGVSKTTTHKLVLHDADMLVQGDYTQSIANVLDTYEACHMGKLVLYADNRSTVKLCQTKIIDDNVICDRIVGYFEGGSLACTKTAYWKVGGFCEDFWGYGVEDCDFYARISNASKWLENRKFDFLHLWHGRPPHWDDHHNENIAKGKLLQMLSIAERIKLQYKRLKELGWQNEISTSDNPPTNSFDVYCTLNGNRTVRAQK